MSVFKLPEGVELDFKVYLTGKVGGQDTEVVITVGGLTSFSPDVKDSLEVERIVKSQGLDDLGSDWRVMSREEIKEYRQREDDAERAGQYTVGL